MKVRRRIRKVGNSWMVPLPPETMREAGFQPGMEVEIAAQPGHVEMTPAEGPPAWLVEFAARFTDRYRADLAELADL
jgi:antitoxin component of MazEF toxin-antitoxin module